MSILRSRTKSFIRWALGDPANSYTVASGGNIVCGPIDLTRIDLTSASIILERPSGEGTLKVSGQLSFDGVNSFFDLGDLITGVTTTSKIFSLSDSSMKYGNYLTLTITETGSSNSANAKCYLMAQGS